MLAISIVVSSYNYADYVGEAIDSALTQTYPGVQVVVVDDGSTDGSVEIIRSYGDTIETLCQANAGQAAAWNSGLAAARGDYVIFLDSDDRLLPHAASVVAARAQSGRPSKVHWRMRLIGPAGQRLDIEQPDRQLPSGWRLDTVIGTGIDPGPNMPSSGNA